MDQDSIGAAVRPAPPGVTADTLQAIVSHLPMAVCLIRGADLRLMVVNQVYQTLAPQKEMVGRTLQEIWPETGQDFAAICRRVLQTGLPHHAEDELNTIQRRPDAPPEAAYFTWSMHRVPLPEDDGWGLLTAAWETTGRRRTEDELLQSRQDLDRAQEVGQIGWWRLDVQQNVLTWSDETYRIFGVASGTALSYETFLACVHPDDRAFVNARWNAALRSEPYDIEHRILANGLSKWVREKAYLEFDAAGGLLGGFGIVQDITARKTAEEEVRRTEEERKVSQAIAAERQRLLDLLESLPATICLLTPQHRVAFANRRFRETFGEMTGRVCYDWCFAGAAPCEFCETYQVLETGVSHRWQVTTPSGRVLDVHDHPFTDADGSPMVLKMGIDVTERHRAETELQHTHEALEGRAAQLSALASELTLSEQRERRRLARLLHDNLQQLLIAAKYHTSILGREGDDRTRTGASLIEHLLDETLSAARSLTSELSPPILHEGGLPAGLEWLAGWMAERHGLRVDLRVDDDLPDLPEHLTVLLFESVRELLLNTVKHARVRSAEVWVRRLEGTGLEIGVADRGVGFDPAMSHKPSGLGLFSVRERVELVGGHLAVESAPGGGSRFTLTIPFAPPASAATAAPSGQRRDQPAAPTADAPAGNGIRVLLVDDHALVREGLRRLLGTEPDLQVIAEAADGIEAVATARTLQPDIVLMDVGMPRLDGVEATRAIHETDPDIPVIGLSAFDDPRTRRSMLDAGAVDFVTKGLPPTELLDAIRRAVRT